MIRRQFNRYLVSLAYIHNDFNRKRNMIIHHGLMGSSKNFKSISKNSHISSSVNSYLVDCRNHGQSPHTLTHSIQDLADDLHQFILKHKLNKQKNNLTIMAHSMGAMTVMKYTQKYPQMQQIINRIILIDMYCVPFKSDKSLNATYTMLSSMLQINLQQQTGKVFKQIQNKATSKDVAGLIKTNIRVLGQKQHKWISNIDTIVKQYRNLNQFRLNPNQWRKPIEVIYGARSYYVNKQQIQQYCKLYPQMKKQQNFYKIEQAGHWVHFQNTTKFLKTVQHILKKDQ